MPSVHLVNLCYVLICGFICDSKQNGENRTEKIVLCLRRIITQIFSQLKFQASGVGVADGCVKAYSDLKLGHKYRYIIYCIKNCKEICVEKLAEPSATYDDLFNDLMEAKNNAESRYAVFDAEYKLSSGQQRTKLVFVFWNPDDCPVKQKMLYSSSKDALKKALNFVAKDFQANDASDLAYTNLLESLLKNEVAE